MSSLKDLVTRGLEAQGLLVEADRAGLSVSDGVDGQKMVVRIDENERVVRVERAICYPVDDFSPELSRAMDYLNQRRAGVCFAYHEAQRALLVSTSWSSPSRDPSANQLHLLVGLVLEAAGRDGPQLERVAEGETSWESLREQDAPEPAPAKPPARSRFKERERPASLEPPTRSLGDGGWPDAGEPSTRPLPQTDPKVTTKFMDHAGGAEGELEDPLPERTAARKSGMQPTRRFEELEQFAADRAPPAEGEDETVNEPPRGREAQDAGPGPRRMSSTALQMAVYRMEQDRPPPVDMTQGRRSFGFRFVKFLLVVGLLGGGGYAAWTYFLEPFFGNRFRSWISAPSTENIDTRIQTRETLVGMELLRAELEDPLEGELHQAYLSRALNAIQDKVSALIELAAVHKSIDVRARAYQLWVSNGFNDDDVKRMLLLRALVQANRHEDKLDRTTSDVLNSLRAKPPSDEILIAALPWSQGVVWQTVIELLARPDPQKPEEAKKRSDALAKQLDRDTPDFHVLRAMVRTGFAPSDAAARLVTGRGLEWARGAEGKQQLAQFITDSPDSITPLLRHADEEYRLLAVDLLVSSATAESVDRLCKVALRDPSLRVRLRTAIGLGSVQNADAAWHLALAMTRREPPPEEAFIDEVRRAIGRLPVDKCVAKLGEHLAPTLPMNERYYAVVALGAVSNAGGLPGLIKALDDPDPQVRRKALAVCEELQKAGSNLGSAVATFRQLARNDGDAGVKQVAARLYKAVVGHDP